MAKYEPMETKARRREAATAVGYSRRGDNDRHVERAHSLITSRYRE